MFEGHVGIVGRYLGCVLKVSLEKIALTPRCYFSDDDEFMALPQYDVVILIID